MRRIRHAIVRSGGVQSMRGLVGRATRPLRRVRVIDIWRKDLEVPLAPFRARAPVGITTASEEDLPRLAALLPSEDRTALYLRRAERGQLCFVALVDDKPVALNWLAFRREVDEDGTVEMADDEVYCFDAFTVPEWRGHAIHTELLSRMLEHARAAGYRTAYTQVVHANRRSSKTHERLGWVVTGKVLYVAMPFGRPAYVRLLSGGWHPIAEMFRVQATTAQQLEFERGGAP